MQIRNASENDVDLLVKMYMVEVESNIKRAHKFAEDLTHRLKTMVCVHSKEINGTISWDTRGGLEDGVVEIVGLGVNQAHRRKGIAQKLMNSLIEVVKEYLSTEGYKLRVAYFFMEANNDIARSLYERFEFNKVLTIPSFYPNGDAELWMKHF